MAAFIPVLVILMFIFVFGTVIFRAVKGIGKWSYNNTQPVLTVDAALVSKRTDVTSGMSGLNDNGMHHHHTYTTCFITFEVESGDRMEFELREEEYGLLAEGDKGRLKTE